METKRLANEREEEQKPAPEKGEKATDTDAENNGAEEKKKDEADIVQAQTPEQLVLEEKSRRMKFAFDKNPELKPLLRSLQRRRTNIGAVMDLYSKKDMTELHIQNTYISIDVVRTICPFLSYINTALVSLNLANNRIDPAGAQSIGNALISNNCLKVLNLASCQITGNPYDPNFDGVCALSKGFQSKRSNLRYINISDNCLMPSGVRILSGAVSFHPTLTALDISDNGGGVYCDLEGPLGISNLISPGQNQICWLNVSQTCFTHRSLCALRDSLQKSNVLTYLDVSNSDLHRYRDVLKQILKNKKPQLQLVL